MKGDNIVFSFLAMRARKSLLKTNGEHFENQTLMTRLLLVEFSPDGFYLRHHLLIGY